MYNCIASLKTHNDSIKILNKCTPDKSITLLTTIGSAESGSPSLWNAKQLIQKTTD